MPNQTEPNANNALGDLLRAMMPDSLVRSENTQTFPAHPGRHADVLVTTPGRSPVVVEAEYEPAPQAEQDAADRLGLQVVAESRTIEAAIALRYPASVRDSYNAKDAVANALVFHERIAGKHEGVKPLNLVCDPEVANPQAETLAAWAAILKINYWPIFSIARDILSQLDSGHAAQVLAVLGDTAQRVQSAGVTHAHDLTGRIFQRLIADRKYLATFYTRPESAALLARLAVAKLEGVDWADPEAIGKLRIGDFACGTGALLDRRVVCDLLGFDESIYEGVRRLAAKWCAEPSVHGGKARPKNAKLVV